MSRTPPKGLPHRDVYVPKHEFEADDPTGTYDGEELARIRSRRPTDERIARLEAKHDKLVEAVGGVERTVANMAGKLDVYLETVRADRIQAHETDRVRIGSRAKVIVGVVGAVCTAIGAAVAAVATGHL